MLCADLHHITLCYTLSFSVLFLCEILSEDSMQMKFILLLEMMLILLLEMMLILLLDWQE